MKLEPACLARKMKFFEFSHNVTSSLPV